jgi:TRAP-type C4-dicarboxylate transport system permease small subunit
MIITGVATVLLVFVPLVLREIGIPFVAYEEFLLIFAFWMYMMGSSYGSYEKSQITADILSQFLKGKPKTALLLINRVGTFILCAIFTYWGLVLVQWTHSTGALTSVYKIPVILGQVSIFISLFLSSIYNFVYMVEDIKNVMNAHSRDIQKKKR